ncbi:MAG TPA: peroxidase-related enzyme [Geminicoccaceae bacterium]|nr:peroxidase-related enzyme [Geminicoccaceae bacterium]
MPKLPSPPDDARLLHVFQGYPATSRPLLEYHQILLRGPSPLSVAERELIAAYVSGLNGCHYCHGVHSATAQAFGVSEGTLDDLLAAVDGARVDARLKPILHDAHKLTLTPTRLTEADAAAVYAAGWDERALHDAVSVAALFNLMNRLVEGLGIDAGQAYFDEAGERLLREGYQGLLKTLDQAG